MSLGPLGVHLAVFGVIWLSGSLVVLEMGTEPGHAYQAVAAIFVVLSRVPV